MPTYAYECDGGHAWSEWQSIHADAITIHPICGRPCRRIIHSAAFHSSRHVVTEVNNREGRWDKDMDAYKRLRNDGLQPPQIDGSHRLEAVADNHWYVNTGGKVNVPDDRRAEVAEAMAEARVGNWSPIEERHRAAGEG